MVQVEQRIARGKLAEEALASLGFPTTRVECHGEDLARIEVGPAEFEALLEPILREGVQEELRQLGFRYVTLDLAVLEPAEPGYQPPY